MKSYQLLLLSLLLCSCNAGSAPPVTRSQSAKPLKQNVLTESDIAQYKAAIDSAEEMHQISMDTHSEIRQYSSTTKWITKAKKQRSYITCLIGYKEIAEPFVKANTACKGQVTAEPIF